MNDLNDNKSDFDFGAESSLDAEFNLNFENYESDSFDPREFIQGNHLNENRPDEKMASRPRPDDIEKMDETQNKNISTKTKKRKRYTIDQKRDFVENLKENLFLKKKMEHSIDKSLVTKWVKAYSLGSYAPELFSNLDKIKSLSTDPEVMLNNIKRKLETKFPQESKLLEVRHIKDLGYGVFAKQIIKEKQSIGIYEGEKIRIKNDEEVQSDYVYSIGKAKDVENVPEDYSLGFRGIDAKRFDSCFGRYINHPPIGFEKNIVSFTRDDIIELRACKEIQVGEQLFLDYGYNYWEGLAMRIVKGHVKKKQLYTDLANEALIQTIDPREPEDSEIVKGHVKKKQLYTDLANDQTIDPCEPEDSDSDSDSDFSNKKKQKKRKKKKGIAKRSKIS